MNEDKRSPDNCPFCGKEAFVKTFSNPYQHGWVGCPECGCYIQWQYRPDEAIKKWNRRIGNER